MNRIFDLYPEQTTRGQILLDDRGILDDAYPLGRLRSQIGIVFQKPTPFNLSVSDNIAFALKHYERLSRSDTHERVETSRLTRSNAIAFALRVTDPATDAN